ncbi:DMT family transporter [Vibrio aestuarianus]|uniref:DMT family transporter n=1 Tax=Vibrio aestuarianus TaxID=28171 RepID=UPI00237D228C|nr:DMT family transporter [Vibrio aestuarianus]MDE1266192.1 DMT family transporter [Vibrio aestuarianus]MDE1298335.1 DMT family transporter [Vibrio aestuarianus]
MNGKQKGGLIALCGVTILSFDSLLVKLVDTSEWNLIFWRGTLLSLTLILMNYAKLKMSANSSSNKRINLSPLIVISGFAFAASSSFFVLALNNTQVTSALVIFNTAPFFAALVAFVFLKEKLPFHTLIAIAVAIVGVGVIFDYAPAGTVTGDLYAIVAAISFAIYLVILRSNQGENSSRFLIAGGLTMSIVGLVNGANPMAIEGLPILYMGVLGCIVVPVSGLCIAKSTQYLPAAQTGLILLLEILLGPFFVYIVLKEQPSIENMLGGGLVLITLLAHTLWDSYSIAKHPSIISDIAS